MNKQFPYFLLHLWVDSLIKIFGFSFLTVYLFLIEKQPFGFIIGILMIIILYKNIINSIRNLYRSIIKKPAIEITDEYFINHMNKKKIHWKSIDKILFTNIRGYGFMKFNLKNRTNYINQIKDPINKLFFTLAPDTMPIQIIVSYIKGNNYKIYEEINNFFLKKKTEF
jgi:hypothetical protein